MCTTSSLEVVNAVTLATTKSGEKFLLVVNQALLDSNPNQMEALLQPHQVRAHGVALDDCALRHRRIDGSSGTQCIKVGECTVPLYYDGWKCYFATSLPSHNDLLKYPMLELTSPQPYEPASRLFTRRGKQVKKQNMDELVKLWHARLGYPPLDVVKKTLEATTQMVTTVEAETRSYMRDHLKARLLPLRPHRVNDVCFSDTFFSQIPSVRGFTMFQLFAFWKSKFDVPYLMKRKSQAPTKFRDLVREVGAPNYMVTDNARELTGDKWLDVCRDFCIGDHTTEAYHPNQNLAERRGGDLKTALLILYHHTPHAPISFWCYALEYLALIRNVLARRGLDWKPAEELMFGETLDISVYRFPWFSPIWYYNPVAWPNDKMISGYFLGVSPSVGDAFSYIIIDEEELARYKRYPKSRIQTLTRSVIRLRKLDEPLAPRVEQVRDQLKFFDVHGHELVGDDELLQCSEETLSQSEIDFDNPSTLDTSAQTESSDASVGSADIDLVDMPPLNDQDSVDSEDSCDDDTLELDDAFPLQGASVPVTSEPILPTNDVAPSSSPTDVPIISQTQEDEDDVSVLSDISDDLVSDVNNHFDITDDIDDVYEDDEPYSIVSHRWVDGILEFQVQFVHGETDFVPFDLVQSEQPMAVAQYFLDNDVGSCASSKRHKRWAQRFVRNVRRVCYKLFGRPSEPVVVSRRGAGAATTKKAGGRRANGKRKKPGRNNRAMGNVKYGVEVPKDFAEAKRLDEKNKNRLWQDAVEKEMAALIHHKCFDFKPSNFKIPSGYQRAHLRMIFEVKADLRHKARLVVQGHLIDPKGLSTRATVVKGVSTRLLDIIADRDNLRILCGDIGNAFVQATTKEKIYTKCGDEFGNRKGCIALIIRALYGLCTSANRWRALFADFLRSMGFSPCRYDRDVWLRARDSGDGYDYICTHVDDFKIVARDPEHWMTKIKSSFLVKSAGEPDYYLGNDFRREDNEGRWTMGCHKYALEAIRKVEALYGALPKYSTPAPATDHSPELDESPLLDTEQHRQFQMLLGMALWLVIIGRPDLCYSVASLSRFSAAARVTHLQLAKQIFGYLKKFPDRRIAIDSRNIDFSDYPGCKSLKLDFLEEYPDAKEEMDPQFPKPTGRPLQTSIFGDADHAHDRKTRRSITGLIAFVGCTPVLWFSKRQGSIASSTYAAEFMALRHGTEEAIALRYMLRCLGIPVNEPTRLFGDNLGVILSATEPDADLKKKHVALSFHVVREAIAAGIITPYWVNGEYNMSDILTKQIPSAAFLDHCNTIFWRPKHRH